MVFDRASAGGSVLYESRIGRVYGDASVFEYKSRDSDISYSFAAVKYRIIVT